MDLGFWSCLWKEGEGKLLLRQRIPEVCVFRGCRLDAWYHNNANGLVVQRQHSVSVAAMLERFLTPSLHSDGGPQTPVAILRTPAAVFDFALVDGSPAPKVPHAAVLTAEELSELVQKLLAGEAPWGVPPRGAGETDVWTIQALIEPVDDVRAISVYSCDATGQERSEIFGRRFHKVYRMDRKMVVPTQEDVAADRCISLPPARRSTMESKTLGVVRFASRFHNLDFEGLVLEFIFDSHNRAVLHSCWASSVFDERGLRRRVAPCNPITRNASAKTPKVFPVPSVDIDAEDMFTSTASTNDEQGESCEPFRPIGLSSLTRELEAELELSPSSSHRSPQNSPRLKRKPPELDVVQECTLLIEVWGGDAFLGESVLYCDSSTTLSDHPIRLQPSEDGSSDTRADERKSALASSGSSLGTLRVSLKWVDDGESAAYLHLGPVRSEALQSNSRDVRNVRVIVWMRPLGSASFSPVWTSKDVQNASSPSWDEVVDLSLPMATSAQKPINSKAAVGAAGSAVRQRRPMSARGRLESPGGLATASVSSLAGTAPAHTRSEYMLPVSGLMPERTLPAELQTSVRSPREHVCGAELSTHWGMNDADGSMSTFVLASQVSQRLSSKGVNGLNRSALLTQLSGQLEQFHQIQLSWDEQWHAARDAVAKAHEELQHRDAEIDQIRSDTKDMVAVHQTRLADICREMCSGVDEHRHREHEDDCTLSRSQQRLSEQRGMRRTLEEEQSGFRSSLEKTHQKLNEVSHCFHEARELIEKSGTKVRTTQGRADDLADELVRDKSEMLDLRSHLSRLKADLAGERCHASRLEDFVRQIAEGPSASVRCGGGFVLDSTYKREAISLLRDAAADAGDKGFAEQVAATAAAAVARGPTGERRHRDVTSLLRAAAAEAGAKGMAQQVSAAAVEAVPDHGSLSVSF